MWIVLREIAVFAPIVGGNLAAAASITPAMAVHGALMLTAWGVLMPAGGVVARYFKVMPGQDFPRIVENLTWWRWHRGLQYAGMTLATTAFGVILSETGGRFDTLHGRCGLVVMGLGWLQVVTGLLRGSKGGPTDIRANPLDPATWRGDHYDMTPRRQAFEAWHKPVGWVVLVLSAVTVLLGLQLADSPGWLLCLVGALQAAICASVADGVMRRRWVDTYASLWGLDPHHPGNRSTAGRDRAADGRP